MLVSTQYQITSHDPKTDSIKYGLRPAEAIAALGSKSLLQDLIAARWLSPVVRQHKLTLYDRNDVARCWERLKNGEHPNTTIRGI
jgi:hypothetical protein